MDIKDGVAVMEKELLITHGASKLFRAQVVLYIGEADRSRDTDGSSTSRQQIGFRQAEAAPGREHVARLVHLPAETHTVRIVANAIANLVKKPHATLDVIRRRARSLISKLPNRWSIEVEKIGRSKILRRRLGETL